ncbi:MAG: PH domain-containing protein [Acidimicrobiales bacterium]
MTESGRWSTPSPRLWQMRLTETGALVLVGLVVAVPAAAAAGGAAAGIAALCVVAAGAVLAWFLRRRVRAWAYQERAEDLLVSRGVLVHRLSVVPYGRMQFVDVRAGPLERVFGLATVHLHTAAAASDARVPGLDREEAARLRDRLAQLGEAKAAGL